MQVAKITNQFTAIIEEDEGWYISYCPEIPGANGQGKTVEECKLSLAQAISLILQDRREDALRGAPDEALKDTVTVIEAESTTPKTRLLS